ncbi:GIY-YIG nuclease family protein [Pseudoalteromonas phenolica]|uniref:GIY-YIG nuclease family protein n=1 Tax=Pseudoalteromonas phenolica TaxID=161398 RepID=UPI003851063C
MDINYLVGAIKDFDLKFKRPRIDALEKCFSSVDVSEENWPRLWADGGFFWKRANEACVYFFFNEAGNLIYIGKAEVLGYRFSAHFSKGSKWIRVVKTVGVLAVPRDSWFEILAIEAYLIEQLQPSENKLGKNSRRPLQSRLG